MFRSGDRGFLWERSPSRRRAHNGEWIGRIGCNVGSKHRISNAMIIRNSYFGAETKRKKGLLHLEPMRRTRTLCSSAAKHRLGAFVVLLISARSTGLSRTQTRSPSNGLGRPLWLRARILLLKSARRRAGRINERDRTQRFLFALVTAWTKPAVSMKVLVSGISSRKIPSAKATNNQCILSLLVEKCFRFLVSCLQRRLKHSQAITMASLRCGKFAGRDTAELVYHPSTIM